MITLKEDLYTLEGVQRTEMRNGCMQMRVIHCEESAGWKRGV